MFASNTTQVSEDVNYIESVFQSWLYTGNGTTQTITNGIDLSGKGGLTWIKNRGAAQSHGLSDTARGAGNWMSSDLTVGNVANNNGGVSAFTSSGFSVNTSDQQVNGNGNTYASWAFRKQPKFFDVVTYTGNGANGRQVSHSLGSSPGFVIIKRTDSTGSWWCWHSSFSAATDYIRLNTTETVNALGTLTDLYQGVSSTTVTVGTNSAVNGNGMSYVMYVFASNAGGFGLTGTDNVISCGSYTGTGAAGNTVNLGYEPQWMLIKASSTTSNWYVIDNMRGMTVGGDENRLFANDTSAEAASTMLSPTATGFQLDTVGTPNASGVTYIYIAIRRGPMKTPTSGTSVFLPSVQNTSANSTVTTNFPVDLIIQANNGDNRYFLDRLRGTSTTSSVYVTSNTTNAETSTTVGIGVQSNTSFTDAFNPASSPRYYAYRRAPGFFDVVCYTGTGTASQTLNHNLGVVPELVINKSRSTRGWTVFQGSTTTLSGFLQLNTTSGQGGDTLAVSSTTFTPTLGAGFGMNTSGENFVTYLFASCPGVSKVGRFTGTGATQTISCGFAARFVMIKRFDSTGDWWVWDTARGMVAGTDPRLALNSTAAETNANWVYTNASGFQIVTTDATVNASGGSYIYLAIA